MIPLENDMRHFLKRKSEANNYLKDERKKRVQSA